MESKPVMPENQMCTECKKVAATTDYNGHGCWVCEKCDEKLNDYFDKEYQ